ncbi:MAG: insulinase family protein [Chloroflexales bacterium]|nr:insulinase family protein [Chloroflexales bacterium]
MATLVTLPSGLRILAESLPHTHSVSLGYFTGVGARHERPELSGVAHFIEHMCFKGTERLPSARAISEAIEGVGGIMNAATAYESTVYWAKVADIHFDRALEVLTDLLVRPLFDAREVEKERKVIIEEIRGTQDSPSEWVHNLLQESLWGQQPLGRDIAGSIETVGALSREAIIGHWRRHYGLSNTVVSVAGNIDPDRAIDAIAQALSPYQTVRSEPALPTAPPVPGPRLELLAEENEQGNFCLGFPALSYNDPDRRAIQVLDTILGGGMSSRLFQELREERGLAYNIGSYQSEVADAGMWVVYGSVELDAMHDSIRASLAEIVRLRDEGVTADELHRVKEQVKGGILLSLEDTWSVASRNGSHMLRYGEVIPIERVVAEVEAVTQNDVLRVAQRVLHPDALHLAVVGPYARPELEAIIGAT